MENYPYNSSYPESGDSSPRSREIDFENPPPWEDAQSQNCNLPLKVKFMCSYGGKIQPRPHDNQLSYVGGETKIMAVDRNVKFASLLSKLVALSDCDAVSFKYQLPGEDLDALISVTNEDDLEHMMHEYDRLYGISPKPARLRIFIFSSLLGSSLSSSTRSFGSEEGKSEKERFVEALNSGPIVTAPQPPSPSAAVTSQPPAPAANMDFLFGFEKAGGMAPTLPVQQPLVGRVQNAEDPVFTGVDERFSGSDPIHKHIQDLQRLRVEEQQGIYNRKIEENVAGGYTGGEYYKFPEKVPQMPVPGGVSYWTEKQTHDGFYASTVVNNEQSPVYMIQAPSAAFHSPMVRPVSGQPNPGFYTVQRLPSEVYRDQTQMYSMNLPTSMPPTLPPQRVSAYGEGGYGIVRQANPAGVGVVMDAGAYSQVAYDRGTGRPVIYGAPGGVMGTPATVQASPYQAMTATVSPDIRSAVAAMNPEAAAVVKPVAKHSQASL